MTGGERIEVTYLLRAAAGEEAPAKAREIALEQTVELPEGAFPNALEGRVVGRIESLDEIGGGRSRATISYASALAAGDLPQLLNLLFGNVSMKAGVRLEAVGWPAAVLDRLPGPRFGIAGLRELSGVAGRPLVATALKPLGLSAAELARLAGEFARAGIDVVKDDHSLADQQPAPFAERVERAFEAVEQANRETGGRTLYFPNLTGPVEKIAQRVEAIRRAGGRGAMVSPLVLGLDAVRRLAETSGLALLGHPALAGAFFGPEHGISPAVLLGDLFRMAGCDGVIYPNAGGRFVLPLADCEAIHARLRRPLGGLAPAFPVPGGGIDAKRVPEWIERFGHDTIFLLGSSLYAGDDPRGAAERLVAAVRGAGARGAEPSIR